MVAARRKKPDNKTVTKPGKERILGRIFVEPRIVAPGHRAQLNASILDLERLDQFGAV